MYVDVQFDAHAGTICWREDGDRTQIRLAATAPFVGRRPRYFGFFRRSIRHARSRSRVSRRLSTGTL